MKNKKLLLIFVKNPKRGKVKTRLAKTIGKERAYQTYLKLIDYTLKVAAGVDAHKQIWYSTYIDESDNFLEEPQPSDSSKRSDGYDLKFEKKLQRGDHLGEKMSNAFKEGFDHGFEKVVIIGSDCPDISTNVIQNAYKKLAENDVVIGPSEDGGYYLIGSNKFIPGIFKNIPWSTEMVFKETIRVLEKGGKSYGLLTTLNDIDTEEDLRRSDFG